MKKFKFFIVILSIFVWNTQLFAQGVTVTSEGVSGDRDKRGRDPEVSVRREVSDGTIRLLVDAHVRNPEYRHYPIRFDFYVNRQFFAGQIRSTELPGPVGVTIGEDVATTPFNYSVVATLIHPNRTFNTVINGAAFSNELSSIDLSCTLVTLDPDGSSITYTADEVSTVQSSNTTTSLSFEGSSTTGESATLSTVITSSGSDATATLSITQDDTLQRRDTTGTVTVTDEDGVIINISLSDSDGDTTLNCS